MKGEEVTNRKQLKFTPFTAESYQRLQLWEAAEKRKEAERKNRSQEAHLKDGELKFGTDEDTDKIQCNPDLVEGSVLKPTYGQPPPYLLGLPLEEVDRGITDKTFVVFSRWLNHINISRFSTAKSFFILPVTFPLRRMAIYVCTNQVFDFFILFVIITNCICLAIPATNNVAWLEYVFFGIYTAEMVIKLVARGVLFTSYTYLRDPWNWLDMIVIASGIPSLAVKTDSFTVTTNSSATQALRTFRVLRAVKTISIFPGLRTIVNAMLRAIKMLMEVVLLTIFCLLVFSLVSVQIYRGTLRQKCVKDPSQLTHLQHPNEPFHEFYNRMLRDPNNWHNGNNYNLCGNTTGSGRCQLNYTCQGNVGENPNFGFMNFDNVYWSALVTFQLMTIDFWENDYRKVLLTNGYLAVIFFFLTVFFGSFYLLNLMLAVVTITYQEEAERTNKEVESEKASKRQRKQAVSAFYNMTKLATKQNVWARLIQENKMKEKEKESPLQKLVRMRAAINIWQKKGHKTSIDRTRVHLFAPYATQDRSAMDVHQNVAYCYKKWVSKTIHLKRNMKRHEAKMGSSQSKLLPLKVGGSDAPRSASDTSFTDDDKSQEQFRGKTASLKRGSIIQSAFRRMSIGFSNLRSYRNSLFQKSASDPKDQKKMQTHEVIGESQTGSLEEKPSESHDRNFSQNQTSGPADDDGDRVDEQSHLVNTVSANNTDNVNAQNNEPASTKTWLLPPEKNQGDRSTTLSAPESTPTDNKKMFTSFSQVGRQVLISAVEQMDYSKMTTSTASYKPLSSAMPMKNAITEKKQKKRAHLTKETPCCFCAGVGSRIQNMVHGIVSDIFFELFIDFCIVLNTALMSVKYHGMTERMENSVDTGGMVFTLIFDVEAVLKIIGFGPKSYFSRRWNRFDFIISLISSISLCLQLIMTSDSNKWLQFLTAFRLLRILKLAQVWPAMNTLLTIIGSALSALGQLTIILGIILYIFAIIGLQLFHDKYNKFQFPNGIPRWNFTDFYHSFMMMFRVLCGEWIEPLMDCMRMKEVPNGLCTLVFFPTLIFGNFVVLNLFLALLLNSFGENTINSADTREAKRLREAKQRFKAKFKWLIHIFNPEREIRLIIHRPSHRDSIIHRPELNEAISAQRLNDSTLGSNHDGSCTTESSKLNPSTTSVVRSPAVSGNASSIYVSIKETRTRKGTVVSSDIKVKPVTPPEDGTDDTDKDGPSPCLPKFILKRMSSLRDRFNNSKCGKKWTALRNAVLERVLTDFFEYIVMFVIILSSVMLAFEDFNFQQTKHSLLKDIVKYANYAFAVLFTLEMIIRWMAYGVTRYFTSAWNIIDFIVVVVSVMGVISVEDEGGKTSGFADFTAFRALRAFRPLRVISRIEGMKIVVNSLMRAIPAILNVFVVSMLFWLIFCVMGVQFFRGKFYKCIYKHSQNRVQSVRTRKECEKNPNWYWYNSNINFDNAASGFLALFQVATFEGWMEIMHDAVDATEVDVQPRFEASPYSYLYFVAFIICGSFFSLNLVIGVIIDNFNVLKKKYEGSYLDGFLTTTQRNYYNTLKKMSTRKPMKIIPPPRTRFQMVFYNLAVSDRFELVLMSVVMLNMIVLGVEYSQYKLTCVWYEVLWVLDVGFCVFFIIEAIMKLVGLRKYYFTLPWNCYDFTVAILTTFDVTVHLIHQYRGLKWPLRVHSDAEYAITDGGIFVMPPIFLRLIRIFRISRVLRIIKVAKGLRKVIFSLVISLPAIINIMALLMLCLYIYAIFGMFLFSNIKINGALTPMMNFRSFKGAALLLLSLSTAAGWNDVLEPLLLAPPFCNKTHFRFDDGHVKEMKGGDCGNQTMAVPYMVSYIILTSLFIINLYIAVILENYNQAHQQDEVGVTEDDFDMFYSVWQRYDPNASQYIPYTQLSNFVADLDPPLGIPKPNEIALVSINLPILQGDRIHCLDILLGLVRNVLPEIDESDELQSMKQQINTRFMARFPLRTKMTQISSTIYRKKQDVAARTLQRAWQVFKTQQAIQSIMKITVKASHRRGSLVGRNPSSVEELTNNMSLAYARYFQKLLKGSGKKEPRGTQFSLRLPKTHAGASDLPS